MLFDFIREHLELIGFISLVDNFIERALPLVVSNPSARMGCCENP
jgi:hypothetical protein